MGSTVLTPPKPKRPKGTGSPPRGGNNGSSGSGGSGRDDHRQPPHWAVPPDAYRAGMWTAIVSITMLFMALAAVMLFRAGASKAWVHIEPPRLLYFNTVVLLLSSLTLEFSRRLLIRGMVKEFAPWLYATAVLGITFLGGQVVVWRELVAQGIYVATNPSSSFFYVLTALHGLHLFGGVLALLYLVFRARQIIWVPRKRVALDVVAIYWHFMDVLWVSIFILLTLRL